MKEKFEIAITSKGQIVIPKKVRKMLGIEAGTKLILEIKDKDLILKVKPKDPLKALLELRGKIKFSRKELDEMMKRSKREWSKL